MEESVDLSCVILKDECLVCVSLGDDDCSGFLFCNTRYELHYFFTKRHKKDSYVFLQFLCSISLYWKRCLAKYNNPTILTEKYDAKNTKESVNCQLNTCVKERITSLIHSHTNNLSSTHFCLFVLCVIFRAIFDQTSQFSPSPRSAGKKLLSLLSSTKHPKITPKAKKQLLFVSAHNHVWQEWS